MGHVRVEDRLRQIQESGVPHIAKAGNCLGESCCGLEVIGVFEDGISEVVLSVRGIERTPFKGLDVINPPNYNRALVRASGGKLKPEFILPGNLETHAIYNPKSSLTHYFILPSRESMVSY